MAEPEALIVDLSGEPCRVRRTGRGIIVRAVHSRKFDKRSEAAAAVLDGRARLELRSTE